MKMSSGQMGRRLLGLTVAGIALAAGGAAFGQQPKPWEMTLQEAATRVADAGVAELPELRAEDLRLALRALGRITGSVGVEDILDTLFARFCIGK